MGTVNIRKPDFRSRTSQFRGTAHTFALQMALDEDMRLGLAARLRELRGARPQRKIAEAIDVTERSYRKWESGAGGIQWDNLEALAEFHKVTTNWLLYGSDTRPENVGSQLDRIEGMLAQLLARQAEPLSAPPPPPEDQVERVTAETRAALDSGADADPRAAAPPPGEGTARATPKRSAARRRAR